jgi:iron-sulfur cluster assembly accessory protein
MSEQNVSTQTPAEQAITKDMMIGDAVSQHPAIADVLLSYGLHCVGCHVNAFETIEQGAAGHGMTPEEIDEMVAEANSYLVQLASASDTVLVTAKAIEKLRLLSAEEGKNSWGLRVAVQAGGCSGFRYELEFEEKAKDDDIVLTEGFTLFIDPESYAMLRGARVDYIDGLSGSGFKIENPNAKSGCGCGKSFS